MNIKPPGSPRPLPAPTAPKRQRSASVSEPAGDAARFKGARSAPPLELSPQPPARSPFLANQPEDVSTRAGIEKLLQLRARVARGEAIAYQDLSTHRTTTTDNQVRLFLDREYFTQGVFPAVASAKRSVHISMLTFSNDLLGS
jgi:hypothetical protein